MAVSVVFGGQFGSEGKGKVAHALAQRMGAAAVVRIGGPNSGHTVLSDAEERRAFRHLPTAALLPGVTSVIGPGSYVDARLLADEIADTGLGPDQVLIDPAAVVVTA